MASIARPRQTSGKKFKFRSLEYQNIGYLLIAPSYFIYFVFTLIPIFWSLAMSFTDFNFRQMNFVGLDNYIRLFQDAVFMRALWNTIYFTILTIFPAIALGLIMAVFLNRKIRGLGFFRTFFYLPNILSVVAVSMAWLYLMDTNAGILNRIIHTYLGFDRVRWLSDPNIAMISVAITFIWARLGYNMILYLAGLQTIPDYLYEAATVDGANALQQFRHITFPLLAPTTFFVFVMACIHSFQVFGPVLILTQGGPINSTTTIAHQIYQNGFEFFLMGYASAQAVMLLLFTLVITVLNMKYGKGGKGSDLSS